MSVLVCRIAGISGNLSNSPNFRLAHADKGAIPECHELGSAHPGRPMSGYPLRGRSGGRDSVRRGLRVVRPVGWAIRGTSA